MNVSTGGSGSTARNEEYERLGILSNCELVFKANIVDRRKAVKVVSGKVILAARCDSVIARNRMNSNDSFDPGKAGKIFYGELKKKINNWKKPDTSRIGKSLPKLDMATKKKR
jgi:RNA processing factor Prp31